MESKKYENSDLQSQLSSTETRLNNLEQEYMRADSERDSLRDALRRFQNSVSRIMKINRFRTVLDDDGKGGDMTDDVIFKSTPFPASDFGTAGAITIDLSNLDTTLANLVARIEQLQRERDQYYEELTRLQQKTSQNHTTINKRETHYKTIEENVIDLEDSKRALESNLTQAKSLIRSQEETLKQRDVERLALF